MSRKAVLVNITLTQKDLGLVYDALHDYKMANPDKITVFRCETIQRKLYTAQQNLDKFNNMQQKLNL